MGICRLCSARFSIKRKAGRKQQFCSNGCKVKFWNNHYNAIAPRLTNVRYGTEARKKSFSERQKQIIYGTLMGDGSLIRLNSGHIRMSMTHADAQRDYMQWKRDQLAFVFHKETPNQCKSGTSSFLVIGSVWHPFLDSIYGSVYRGGRKRIPLAVLNGLSPLMLAVWYQDDGSYLRTSKQVVFCTDSFPRVDVVSFVSALKRLGITASILTMRRGGGTFDSNTKRFHRVLVWRRSMQKFFDLIKPHTHPCMTYKLG